MIFGVPTGQKCHFCTKGTFWCGDSENSQEPKIWPIWRLYDVIFQNGGNFSLISTQLTASVNWSLVSGAERDRTMIRYQLLHSMIYKAPFQTLSDVTKCPVSLKICFLQIYFSENLSLFIFHIHKQKDQCTGVPLWHICTVCIFHLKNSGI